MNEGTKDDPQATNPEPGEPDAGPLLKIQEAATETGLTTRAIRYYEEKGLLEPAGRSDGDYRLYDTDDLERLRFIRGLREDAGFSLADISAMLEDEDARTRLRARFHATSDRAERREILLASMAQVEHQVGILEGKVARLTNMIDEALARRERLQQRLDDLDRDR